MDEQEKINNIYEAISLHAKEIFIAYEMLEPHKTKHGAFAIPHPNGYCLVVFKGAPMAALKIEKYIKRMKS
jgi:hypothetical protein